MRYIVSLFRGRSILLFVLMVMSLVLGGCSTMPVSMTTDEADTEVALGDSELLRPGDLLKISFKGPSTILIPDHEERVPESGYITLRDIGKIDAVGKTRVQLQEEIRKRYVPSHYRELAVTVAPAERFFYVSGDVRKPDRHPYLGKLTLTAAITAAGDFNDFADKTDIRITRTDGRVLRGDYLKALENPTLYDLKILPGDKIHVRRSKI